MTGHWRGSKVLMFALLAAQLCMHAYMMHSCKVHKTYVAVINVSARSSHIHEQIYKYGTPKRDRL